MGGDVVKGFYQKKGLLKADEKDKRTALISELRETHICGPYPEISERQTLQLLENTYRIVKGSLETKSTEDSDFK